MGGTIRSHPTAGAALGIMSVRSAQHLGEIIAAVGLAQNLAALRALATEGIQRGHMSMHARSLVARVLADRPEEARPPPPTPRILPGAGAAALAADARGAGSCGAGCTRRCLRAATSRRTRSAAFLPTWASDACGGRARTCERVVQCITFCLEHSV